MYGPKVRGQALLLFVFHSRGTNRHGLLTKLFRLLGPKLHSGRELRELYLDPKRKIGVLWLPVTLISPSWQLKISFAASLLYFAMSTGHPRYIRDSRLCSD